MFERLAYRGYLFGLEVVDLLALHLRQSGAGGYVDGRKSLFKRLFEYGRD